MAALVGMRVIAADVKLLPEGCRAIPTGHFNFDPSMVKFFGGKDGLAKAVIYQRFMGWIESNYSRGHNIRDGQAWSYNTYKQWTEEIPFLHYKTIQKHVLVLEAMGLLTSKQFDQEMGNPRKYYSSPLQLADTSFAQEQMLLPMESLTPMGGVKDSALYNTEPAIQKPSKPKRQTPTPPARALLMGGVGVFPGHVPGSEMPEKKADIPEVRPDRRDGSDLEDIDETPATRVNAPTPFPRGPFPDDTTEGNDDTEPIIPVHAQIFAIVDTEVRGWIDQDGDRLKAWCEYAAAEDSVRSPGGLVRAAMRAGGMPPPPVKSDEPKSYLTGQYTAFIEH